VFTRLGHALNAIGHTDAAHCCCWQEALSIYQNISDSRANEIAELLT